MRIQKKLGLVTAYDNELLLECLQRGVDMVNGYWPPSTWSITQVPQALSIYSIIAGCWWALESQRILYAETNLNFSGQTVTLEYNPGADIESAMQGLKDTLDNRLSAQKKNVIRSSRAVGSVATRPYRYRSSLVFKIDAGGNHDIVQDMILLGILD